MQSIWAEHALTSKGWYKGVKLTIDQDGIIQEIDIRSEKKADYYTGILLAAQSNLHSHSFQRAIAGLTEKRSSNSNDSFWTWRDTMYRFVEQLTPEDVESIAAFVQMESLEAGYASIAEFHYLHHANNGKHYDNIAEMSLRIIAAAEKTGIGLTLLPVLYEQANSAGKKLEQHQLRFGNDIDQFARLTDQANQAIKQLPKDSTIGIAPHSLRAVSQQALSIAAELLPDHPLHIHIAEQMAEVEELETNYGKRPVEWLLEQHNVNQHWCLVHATHMTKEETHKLAKTQAVAGICPITEANLGDGIFDAASYLQHGGRFGVGSDSNIRISVSEELRLLEYSQRLRDQKRAVLSSENCSTGRFIYEHAALGSAQACGRNGGIIEESRLADLIALDHNATSLIGKNNDTILDTYIFASDDQLVTDVWSAGRHLVKNGKHIDQHTITEQFRDTLQCLGKRI